MPASVLQDTAYVNVVTVDLEARGITVPADRVGMVLAQPFPMLEPTEPFRFTSQSKPGQLTVLARTLDVAAAAAHGAAKTNFTVFPEYSIPGLDGIAAIEQRLSASEWPTGTIVIGGTDALSQADYAALVQSPGANVDPVNGPERVQPDEWINCSITWIKTASGNIEKWLQPKLHPAWEELNISYESMFRGRSVFVFAGLMSNGTPFRFGTIVCFDWIANLGNRKAAEWICAAIEQHANGHQLPLSWLFVIQHNPKPSHHTFLGQVEPFFNQTMFPNALRSGACLVFVNNAGRPRPGKTAQYGGCGMVFSPQAGFSKPTCAPTFCNGGPRFREGSTLLQPYRDVLLRERGACIHSFAQILPGSLTAGAVGRAIPLDKAQVFPLDDEPDPRTPSSAVPASVKWLNDELDEVRSLTVLYPNVALAPEADQAHRTTVATLRRMPAKSIDVCIKFATQGSAATHADEWDVNEQRALQHLVSAWNIITIGAAAPPVPSDGPHAHVNLGLEEIALLAVTGVTHQACVEHFRRLWVDARTKALLVSRDTDNTPWHDRLGSFLRPEKARIGAESKITDPDGSALHIGYTTLLDIFRESTTQTELLRRLNAELA